MSHQRFVGIILILAGGMLLVHQLGWLDLDGSAFIGILSVLIGLSFLRKALLRPDHKGVLGGTFFTLFGLALLLFSSWHGPLGRALLVGALFVSLAAANLTYFFANGMQRTFNLFMFFFFGAIGGSILMVYFGVFDVWQFEEVVSTYWPLILVALGLAILVDSALQKKKRIQEDQMEPEGQEKESV
ncbi:hypothetical protein ACX8XN_01360 [Calditrichota bacterium GD2]